jgi:hypothetical protein
MNEGKVKQSRRQIRKALGPQSLDILAELETRILELEKHLVSLTTFRGRLLWLLRGAK